MSSLRMGYILSSGLKWVNGYNTPSTKKYTFQTVGQMDTVMVVSEKAATENYYLSGDDDSGLDKNSKITLPLVKGRDSDFYIQGINRNFVLDNMS